MQFGVPTMTDSAFTFTLKSIPFDEEYRPADNTRITTNFANLARGERREENLRNTLRMIDNRFNSLAHLDNPAGDRYALELTIITAEMHVTANGAQDAFPLIEILRTTIIDKKTRARMDGIVGNNFSSYIRDYDFSVVLPEHSKAHPNSGTPEGFGDLHGNLFKHFLKSEAYRATFSKPPVICLSVSSNKTYQRTGNEHPILGFEYENDEFSATDDYFAKMGMKVRYFMPRNSAAPFAFYHIGDLLGDYTNLELVSTIAAGTLIQKAKPLMRGNAISFAPIINGTR